MEREVDDRVRHGGVPHRDPIAARSTSTSASTIEAMLYVLRRGLACLDDSKNRDRLRCCDDAAMKEIVTRLRTWKARNVDWLPAWSDADIARLAKAWRSLREGKA